MNNFPRSPDLDSGPLPANLSLFKERSSPLSMLANELDSGLSIACKSGQNNGFISSQ